MPFNLKPDHKAVKAYYNELANLTEALNANGEGSVSPVFAALLRHCAAQCDYTLIEQYPLKRAGQNLRADGGLVDSFKLLHGLWEAKDSADDLDKEIEKKVTKGYPRDNILFQAPRRAVLYQDGQRCMDADLTKPEQLIEILKQFVEYEPPAYEQWGQAVEEFKLKVPELGEALLKLIEEQRQANPAFVAAFENFASLVRDSINPNISTQALEEMLIQHLLTERIFRTIFNNPDFATRNVIAREIEKVIQALTAHSFSRDEFLKSLDRFYGAIETTAATIDDFSQKQAFLNTVYEKFFQGFSVKAADVYGIVYTPQPIVNFMIHSVEHILQEEFGRSLSDEDVHIIDPFVGTGNFIINIMRQVQKTKLPYKYANELHCNEVMLLPYYIASMNIEHAYYELTGAYLPFEGICLVDTFDINEQMTIFGHENTERIARQRNAPIFVVIANPPYNAGQVNENDNNKNRKYPVLEKKIASTYGKSSKSQLQYRLNDPYIKAIRWATDRIGEEGIVAYITNNSFINDYTFDGVRSHLEKDFSKIIHINLKGNAHTSGIRRQKEGGNIFNDQIKVSVGITFFIRIKNSTHPAEIEYYEVEDFKDVEWKIEYLERAKYYSNLPNKKILISDIMHTWLSENLREEFKGFTIIGNKKNNSSNNQVIFRNFFLGVATNRDTYVYNFSKNRLIEISRKFISVYNAFLDECKRNNNYEPIFDVKNPDIKWTRQTKNSLLKGKQTGFSDHWIKDSLYRPFVREYLYFDNFWNEEQYQLRKIIVETEPLVNQMICSPSVGGRSQFWCLATNLIPNLTLTSVDGNQCFPFYTYSEDGTNRTENITDWALAEFRNHYNDPTITKWDIFYYVYGFLHAPGYRSKYAANLRRELPRLPFAPDFRAFSAAGKRLADLHVNYETQPEYPLTQIEAPGKALDWRVEKMKLSPDKTTLIYNDFLSLSGIPAPVYDYKLGNRSALEWIVDQYRIKTDPRSGITNDPNNPDDPEYIVRLVKKIVTVSLETIQIVKSLPEQFE